MAMASWDFTTLEYVMGFLCGESVHPDLQAMRSAQAVSSVLAHNLSSHLDILEGMLQKVRTYTQTWMHIVAKM